VLNEVLRWILQPLTFKQNPGTKNGYYNILCADGNFRHLKQVLASWRADCPEYSNLHRLEQHVCFWCECWLNKVADYVPPDKQHPRQNHSLYRTLSNANTKAANAEPSSHHFHQGFTLCRAIPCIMSDIPKPDLLHPMLIGMLVHLQKGIFHFMKPHERLDKYNAIPLSMLAYHALTQNNTSSEEVTESNGKEMKEMRRNLLGVVTQSLRSGSPTQRPIFNHPNECTWALFEFCMYVWYKSHDDVTLSYMEAALRHFYTFKDVFLLRWASRKRKATANALRLKLVKKWKVDEETNTETWTPS